MGIGFDSLAHALCLASQGFVETDTNEIVGLEGLSRGPV